MVRYEKIKFCQTIGFILDPVLNIKLGKPKIMPAVVARSNPRRKLGNMATNSHKFSAKKHEPQISQTIKRSHIKFLGS